ncbi:hypothetical protein FB451DRAFT_134092 [Mycena latifolia]|nr:hypothetical protein FB451DRAFT_134092 [Mycena latifolia]
MEKAPGVQLMDRWMDIRGPAVKSLIDDVVEVEQKMTDTEFAMLGSLYLADDLPEGVGSPALRFSTSDKTMPRQYKIGPSVDRRFWRGHGPRWKSIVVHVRSSFAAYARAIAQCEIAWLRVHAKPHSPTSPLYRSPAENDPQTHIELLEAYLCVLDYLVPPRHMRAFTLWHPDLHASNIIITSSSAELPRIESIIDWQTARIEPLLHAGTIPTFLDYSRGVYVLPAPPGRSKGPVLPSNFDTLDAEAQRLAKVEMRSASRNKIYEPPHGRSQSISLQVSKLRTQGTIHMAALLGIAHLGRGDSLFRETPHGRLRRMGVYSWIRDPLSYFVLSRAARQPRRDHATVYSGEGNGRVERRDRDPGRWMGAFR